MNNCPLSTFKNIFGSTKTGLHKFRFNNTAIFDYIITIIIAMLTSYFSNIPLVISTIGWLLIGFILHIIFGVQTHTLTYLGIKC